MPDPSSEQQTKTIQQAIDLAVQHHTTGDLPKAKVIYQQILQTDPNHPVALHLLGVLAHQMDKNDTAVDLIIKALAINPDYAEAHNNLGNIFKALGRLDEAVASCQKALAFKSDYAEAHNNLGLILQEQSKLSEAIGHYLKALTIKPDFAQAYYNLGNAFFEQGKLDDAIASYREAFTIKPDYVEVHNNLGSAYQKLGQLDEAVSSYHKALAFKPDFVQANYNLGNALKELGNLDEAVSSYRKAIAVKPDLAEAHNNLGFSLQKLGKSNEAVASYHKALAKKPDYPEAHNNLGVTLQEMGRPDEAIDCYRKALTIKPDYPEAYNNLGNGLKELGKLEEAVASYQKSIDLKSDYAKAYSNLGMVLEELGQLEEAVASYNKATAISPDFPEAYCNLGNAFRDLGKWDKAIASYNTALTIKPDFPEALNNLGNAYQESGNTDEAVKQMDLALSYKPEMAGWRIRKALFLPVIPSSQEDIHIHRKTLSKAVTSLIKENLIVPDPVLDVGLTNFYLAYHGCNNKSLMQDIAKLYLGVCPKLAYEAKHCQSKQRTRKDVLRIGFLSSYFRDHTIGKLTRGIIEHISRDLFEVIIFRPAGKRDHISAIIDQVADTVITLHRKLERDRGIIEEEELDVLFYPDIGMDPYTYFLSFARLAPVQVVTWGHPDTTGIPNIDYFLSSEISEPIEVCAHNSEQLIKLNYLPTYYYRPNVPEKPFIRSDYGLPEEGHLYICPQSLFKFHPSFDDILGKLLRQDSDGCLVLIGDTVGGYWERLLHDRFKRAFPDVIEKIIFIPQMPNEKFLGLLILADTVLDIPTFSGGNSSFETLAMCVPVVTWPHDFMRGRITAALYKQMGLSDLIATDEESYLTLALRLAQDTDFKRRMQADINVNLHKLYERHEVILEVENFFLTAYEAWKTGENLVYSPATK